MSLFVLLFERPSGKGAVIIMRQSNSARDERKQLSSSMATPLFSAGASFAKCFFLRDPNLHDSVGHFIPTY